MKVYCQSAYNFVTISKGDKCVYVYISRELLQLVGFCSGKEKAFEQGKKLKSRFVALPSERVRLKVVLGTCR